MVPLSNNGIMMSIPICLRMMDDGRAGGQESRGCFIALLMNKDDTIWANGRSHRAAGGTRRANGATHKPQTETSPTISQLRPKCVLHRTGDLISYGKFLDTQKDPFDGKIPESTGPHRIYNHHRPTFVSVEIVRGLERSC